MTLSLTLLASCHQNRTYAPLSFQEARTSPAPNYSELSSWAAHPLVKDLSDSLPKGIEYQNIEQSVDVFFIHPTTFLEKTEQWNADLEDRSVNLWTDEGPIKHQASVFNNVALVYAPRYRQAHLKSYFTSPEDARMAFDLAYNDVSRAFEHFLSIRKPDRPFILASHSQGTTHGIRLIQEYLDGTALSEHLIAAYLIGMTVLPEMFEHCKACEDWEDSSCYITWMTYDRGYHPSFYKDKMKEIVVFNPILGNISHAENDKNGHLGIVNKSFQLKYRGSIIAQRKDGLLWIRKPRVPFGFLMSKNNWHIADYNLFYENIRQGLRIQVNNFFVQKRD